MMPFKKRRGSQEKPSQKKESKKRAQQKSAPFLDGTAKKKSGA